MCLDGLHKWKLCQSPLLCQPREDGKARPESILFTRHTAKMSILPSLFGMPLQNFIWEHKIYYCTCKSICLISHQRTDPTVEYSLKNGAAVKQLPFAIIKMANQSIHYQTATTVQAPTNHEVPALPHHQSDATQKLSYTQIRLDSIYCPAECQFFPIMGWLGSPFRVPRCRIQLFG